MVTVNLPEGQVRELNKQFELIAKQVRSALDSKNYPLAKQILTEQALPLMPHHPIMLSDLALVEHKLGNDEQAYTLLQQALTHNNPVPSEVYDELVSLCADLRRYEEARFYAKRAIALKKQEIQRNKPTIFPIPNQAVPQLSTDRSRNVISFSLFGQQPRYCETAVINVGLAKTLYPEWTCRFYVDDSVPVEIKQRLKQAGGDVIEVDCEQKQVSGLFWRFFVVDDPNVDVFLIRDADSLFSNKEQAAVKAWLKSGKWFHLMRDAVNHSELILAGMWGGYRGVFRGMQQLVTAHFKQLKVLNKTIDQVFLRRLIYPTVAQSVLIHDNLLLDPASQPYPDYELSEIEKLPYFHIGMIDSAMKDVTFYLQQPSEQKRVRWFLLNEQNQPICSYESEIITKNGQSAVVLNLPYFYAQKIAQQQWRFSYQSP